MTIYVNDKATAYENIFDLLECPWYYVSSEMIERDYSQVLDDWINTNKTYYYIHGKRYDFELK